jgi:hypothetical protein
VLTNFKGGNMLSDYLSNLMDVQVNYLGVLISAAIYFILAIVWYSPQVFGKELIRHEIINKSRMTWVGLAYLGELIIAIIMAFVLALVIELALASTSLEGLKVAFWMWLGFVATTHLCDFLWGRKSFTSYLITIGLILVGLLIMGAVYPAVRDMWPDYILY